MADEKNPWTTAFEETAREKKRMETSDVDKPRSNEGKYNESEYHPNRKKRIALARRLKSTGAADMEKAANIKKAARRAAYAASKTGAKILTGGGVLMDLVDPTELGAAERMSDELKSELNQMEEYKKGGIVGRGQGRAIRIKTTKQY